jgi:hypothetical protein
MDRRFHQAGGCTRISALLEALIRSPLLVLESPNPNIGLGKRTRKMAPVV